MSFKESGWIASQVSLVVLCTLSAACMTQSPSASDESASARKQAVSVRKDARAPQSEAVLVRPVGDSYEIEVRSPKGFPARAFDPVLRIGEQEFRSYRESETVGVYGVVYTVSATDFQALPEGGSVSVGYGPSPHAATNYGNLNKGALSVVK
jgi:hypothetical protein